MRGLASLRGTDWLAGGAQALVWLLLAVVTLLYTPRLADSILGKGAAALLIGGLLVPLWIVGRWLCGAAVVLRSPVHLPFAVLLLVTAVAVVPARNPGLAAEQWLLWALWFGWFAVLADLARDADRARRVVDIVFGLSVVVSALGLLQTIGIDLVELPRRFAGMPLATLGNTNFVAHYLEIVLPLALAFTVSGAGGRRRRLLAATALLLGGLVLVLAGSRGGWLGVGVGTALMAWLAPRPPQLGSRILLVLLVVGLLSPVAAFVLESIPLRGGGSARDVVDEVAAEAWDKAMTTFDAQNFSRGMRLLIWRDSARMVAEHPVLGVGPGHFGLELPAHRTSTGQRQWRQLMGQRANQPYHAHNELLETWAEVGVGGAAALLWLFGAALFMSARAGRRTVGSPPSPTSRYDRSLACGAAGSIAAAAVHALFSFNLRDPVAATHLWLVVGLAAGAVWRLDEGVAGVLVHDRRWRAFAVVVGLVLGLAWTWHGLCILMGDRYNLRSHQHLVDGHGNRAILALRQAVDWRGHEHRYHHDLGQTALQMGRTAEAEQALRRSLELHAHNPAAIRLLARALLAQQRAREAAQVLRRAVDIDPLTTANYVLLADALRAAQQPVAAAVARRQAVALSGDSQLLVGLAFDHLAADNADAALAVLEEAARTAPRDRLVFETLGAVQLSQGQPVAAEVSLRRAMALAGKLVPDVGANLALALAAQGKLEAALTQARAVAAAAPEEHWQTLVRELESRLEAGSAQTGD